MAERNQLAQLAFKLERGCSCEYDHRCTNCQRILDVREAAKRILDEVKP